MASSAAVAHTVWLTPEPGSDNTFRVMFGGHAGALEPYDAAKLKQVTALDAHGRTLPVQQSGGDSQVRLEVEGKPVMVAVHFDNGIHTRRSNGPGVEKPMNEVDGAISASSAVKYHKTIVDWGSEIITRPIGQPFEVIPLSAEAPRAGQSMRIQVRIDGRPAAGVGIGRGEETNDGVTDANGEATFVPAEGFNRIWAGRRIPIENNPAYTELSYEYSFGFDAR